MKEKGKIKTFEIFDPRAGEYGMTYSFKSEMAAIRKADELGSTRVHGVTENERIEYVKRNGEWVREDGVRIGEPHVDVSALGSLGARIEKTRALSDSMGITADIEKMTYDGNTAREIAEVLRNRLEPATVKQIEAETTETGDLVYFVRQVRLSLGAPSLDDERYPEWKEGVAARLENAPVEAATGRNDTLPRVDVSKVGSLGKEIEKSRNLADQLDVTGDIEKLAFRGNTAKEIAEALGSRLGSVIKQAEEEGKNPVMEMAYLVRRVRTSLGIPSMAHEAAYQAWRYQVAGRLKMKMDTGRENWGGDGGEGARDVVRGEQEATRNGFVAGDGGGDGGVEKKAAPVDPEHLVSKVLESVTYKMRQDGSVLYMLNDRAAFVDLGQQILMESTADKDEKAILAAVLLAKEKYSGGFELTGSDEFKRRAIEVMLKHRVEVKLKNPQQDALRRELAKEREGDLESEVKPVGEASGDKRVIGRRNDEAVAHAAGDDSDTTLVSASGGPEAESAPGPLAAELRPVRAREWWRVQREAIQVWAKDDRERTADLKRLGPEPSVAEIYWFNKSGKQCAAPVDAGAYLKEMRGDLSGFVSGMDYELRERDGMGSEARAEMVFDSNVKELIMAATTEEAKNQGEEPKLILRGVKKLDNGEFDTTVLLFKGKGDYLQGYVKVGDEKRQVLAHLNERKPDPETGEVRPNFITLSERHGQGDDTKWKEIGYGNAINHRKDGKPVYFDEVLLSIGKEVVSARTTKHVDDELQRQLGFQEGRQARPKYEDRSAAQGEASPKPMASAAKIEGDAADAVKVRRSSRAKA